MPTGEASLGRGDLLLSHLPEHSCKLTDDASIGNTWFWMSGIRFNFREAQE